MVLIAPVVFLHHLPLMLHKMQQPVLLQQVYVQLPLFSLQVIQEAQEPGHWYRVLVPQ